MPSLWASGAIWTGRTLGRLRTLDQGHLPARYLDGAGIPLRYKLRRVEGEPVPVSGLAEMERHSAELWKARGPSAESRPLSGFGKSPS